MYWGEKKEEILWERFGLVVVRGAAALPRPTVRQVFIYSERAVFAPKPSRHLVISFRVNAML